MALGALRLGFGASFYTYTPIRVMWLVPLLWSVYILTIRRGRSLWPGALLFLAALALTTAPLATFALQHRDQVLGRSAGLAVVSLDNSLQHIIRTLSSQTTIVMPMFIIPAVP